MDQDVQYTPNPFATVKERHWDDSHPAPWTRPNAAEDPTVRFFWVLLVAHVILWTALATVTQPNLPFETVELLSLGSQPQWGYYDHAPLPAWIAYAACALLGKAAWPAYLIAQLCTAVCLWAAWRISREFLHPWTAVCAAFALEGCLLYTFDSAELSPYVFSRCWWALGILTFYWALVGNRRRHWLATAVYLALGFLSTYDTALLFGAMVLFTVFNDRARQCWDSSRPILAMMLMGILLLPHTLWLFRHDFVTITTTIGKTSGTTEGHLVNPLWFGLSQLGAFIPVIILLAPLIRSVELDEAQQVEPDREFLRRYIVWITALPFAVMFAGSLVTGAEFHTMWSGGLWTFAGVALLLWSRLDEQRWGWRRSILFAGGLAGAFAAALIVHHTMLPGLREVASPIHFPGQALAQTVESTWKSYFPDRKLAIVGGNRWLAGNASWYSHDSPGVYTNLNTQESPWINDEELARDGGIVVWDADNPGNWAQIINEKFPFPASYVVPQPALLKYQTRARLSDVKLAMAVISPKGVAPRIQQTTLLNEAGLPVFPGSTTIPAGPANPSTTIPNFEPPLPYNGAQTSPREPGTVTSAEGFRFESPSAVPASSQTLNQRATGSASRPPDSTIPTRATPPASGNSNPAPNNSTIPVRTGTPSSSIPPRANAPSAGQPTGTIPNSTSPTSNVPRSTIPSGSTIPQNRSSSLYRPGQSGNSSASNLTTPIPPSPAMNPGILPTSGQSPNPRAYPTQLQAN